MKVMCKVILKIIMMFGDVDSNLTDVEGSNVIMKFVLIFFVNRVTLGISQEN